MQTIPCFFKRAFSISLFLFPCFCLTAQNAVNARGATVGAATTADTLKGDVYAIVMGVSKYQYVTPSLQYADEDAILFSNFLKTPGGGNIKPENIKLLTNENAKMSDFWEAFYKLRGKPKKGDKLYLYFSGHGVATDDDHYYVLPYDCNPNKDMHLYNMTSNINIYDVKTMAIKPEVDKGVDVVLIIDACRSIDIPGGAEGGQQTGSGNFIEQKQMGETILLSTGRGKVSIESPNIGGGHGLYTYYLVDGLLGAAADTTGTDNTNNITLDRIADYVRRQVKDIAKKSPYNTDQIPYYCCDAQDLLVMAKVDKPTFTAWRSNNQLISDLIDPNSVATNTVKRNKGIVSLSNNDTSQIKIYNRFVDALKSENLIGDSSAETYYKELEKNWTGSSLTEDAKYSLATRYLNFCMEKINLFLSGKGLVQIIYMEKENSKKQAENNQAEITDPGEQIKKLKTLVTTGFDKAAMMMQKAFDLLNNQPALLAPYISKLDFLKTMAAYADKTSKLKDVQQQCRKVIAGDPLSPAGYQLIGWIYQDMQDDSCAYYFMKAAAMAPKWAYPMNGLGNYYIFRNDKKKAIQYFFKAIQLDSLFSSSYRNIATTYYNLYLAYPNENALFLDSVKIYSRKALNIDSIDQYAYQDLGDANLAYVINIDFDRNSNYLMGYYNRAKGFYMQSIACDKKYISGYQKLAALYSYGKNEDSALATLQNCASVNPDNAEAFRNLGKYYLSTRKDTAQAEAMYKKAISVDPSDGDSYYFLARLYRKEESKDKAINTLTAAMDKIGDNKNLYNEMGNIYFEAFQFDNAIAYYNMALKIDPTLSYVYFNLGKLHGIKDVAKDSSIYYYSKAVFYDPDRFHKLNNKISDFYLKQLNAQASPPDLERLITALINEGNLADADSTLKKYMDPEKGKDTYARLAKAISDAAQKK